MGGKLIIAIVQDEDAPRLITEMMSEGFSATKLATTGGFLRSGNTTLLLGVNEEQLSKCLGIIERICKSRQQISSSPVVMGSSGDHYMSYPIEVTVGSATVFVLQVEQFIKL